jgi:hypothetical protein
MGRSALNTPWQDLICNAALASTLRGHENLVFSLKWRDLRALCGELGSLNLAEDKPEGMAISARVWCYALRRQVIVNEWSQK